MVAPSALAPPRPGLAARLPSKPPVPVVLTPVNPVPRPHHRPPPRATTAAATTTASVGRRQATTTTANTYPVPETEKERSPIDFPQEWVTPQPTRRPDTQPEFEKLDTPMPKPLPGDPEPPDDEAAEEEEKKRKKKADPDDPDAVPDGEPGKENPDKPPRETPPPVGRV